MRTIAIINLKGGVGKTTTAINMAAILAGGASPASPGRGARANCQAGGKKVLVIDADPQANASQFFGMTENHMLSSPLQGGESGRRLNTLYGLMEGYSNDAYDFIYETGVPGISIVPASIDLIDADIASIREGGRVKCIADLLDALREDSLIEGEGGPDFCIIDCPPSFTAASVAAIYAADEVIIPVEVDAFSVMGMAQVLKQIASVQKIQPRVRVAGVLITKWHNTPAVVQGEAALRQSAVPVFRTMIRRSDKVAESLFKAQTLEEYSRTSAAAKDYRLFVEEYLEQVPAPAGREPAGKGLGEVR